MTRSCETLCERMSDVVWSDPEWLQFFPLNTFTALDYFARSPFYDAACNNELLRRQGQDLSRLPYIQLSSSCSS